MGSKHQRFYKSRGNSRRTPGDFSSLEGSGSLDHFAPRGDYTSRNNRYAYQRDRGGSRRFQRARGPAHLSHQNQNQRIITAPWYRITITNGKSIGHEELLKELSAYAEGVLNPVLFRYLDGGDAEFLLEDNDVALAVQAASRRISSSNGKKLIINATRTRAPVVALQPEDITALKKLLERRYSPGNDAMDLSNVGDDPTMNQEHGNFLPLSRNNVALTISTLIGQACPNLKTVDISKNKLRFLDYLTNLAVRCSQVYKLNLSSNYLENIMQLEKLWPWKNTIVDLNLELNPLCKRFRDRSSYITAIRRLFPKLNRLDGIDLPPAFKTGIEEELSITSKLPPIQPSFYVDDHFKVICVRFVDEFFAIFDDPDRLKREKLYQAYDDDAVFTLSAHNLTEESNRLKSECWQEFIRDSHNIKHIAQWERFRSKLVHKGRLSIVSYFVKDFPIVKHDYGSFVNDISFASKDLICLNVSGLYKLTLNTSGVGSLRFFTRTFLLVPKNEGLAIINEELFCTTLVPSQEANYRRNYDSQVVEPSSVENMLMVDSTPSQISMISTNTTGMAQGAPTLVSAPVADEVAKRRMMIDLFSKNSGMKAPWAEKCLEDCDWDFERAALTFTEMKKLNVIPLEAFG